MAYLLVTLTACSLVLKKPDYNWDILPYIGAAHSFTTDDTTLIHLTTYEAVKTGVSPADYVRLTQHHPFRERMAQSASAFCGKLPFYYVKPLYVGMVWLLMQSGVPAVAATTLPSAIAYALLSILVFTWLQRFLSTRAAFFSSVLLMLSPPVFATATLSTPDMLSAALVTTSLFFLLEKQRVTTGLVILLFSVTARPDNFLLLTGICVLLALKPIPELRISRLACAAFAISGIIVYTLITSAAGYYGANGLVVLHSINSTASSHHLLWKDYARRLVVDAFSVTRTHLPIVLAVTLPILLSGRSWTFTNRMYICLLLVMCARFFVYPLFEDRLLLQFYIGLLMIAAMQLRDRRNVETTVS